MRKTVKTPACGSARMNGQPAANETVQDHSNDPFLPWSTHCQMLERGFCYARVHSDGQRRDVYTGQGFIAEITPAIDDSLKPVVEQVSTDPLWTFRRDWALLNLLEF